MERAGDDCLLVCGELDLAASSLVRDALADERIEAVDLSGVTFIDLAGLQPLLDVRRERGRQLALRRPSPCAMRLLELVTALDGALEPSGEAADAAPGPWSPTGADAPGPDASTDDDPERPLDQLVDEVSDRLDALATMLGGPTAVAVDPDAARRGGRAVLDGLASEQAVEVAALLLDALWSTSRGGRVPAGWLSTPLGSLISGAVRA